MSFRFDLHQGTATGPRLGTLHTPHGAMETPAFMPVGTKGTVKGLTPSDLRGAGAGVVLGNTYHLLFRPGPDVVEALGGIHGFSGWPGLVLTDSGGYQVFSLEPKVDDDGVVECVNKSLEKWDTDWTVDGKVVIAWIECCT